MKKLSFLFSFLLVFSINAFAGIEKYESVVQSSSGTVLYRPTVTVYSAGTLTKATLYSGITGSAIANPITGDSSGRYSFFADEGYYDLSITKSGYTTQTKSYIHLGPSQALITTHTAATGTNVHGLGTLSTQNSDSVNITGGTITPLTIHSALTGTNAHGLGTMSTQSTANYVTAATFTVHTAATGTNTHGLGTMSTQNSDSIAITGGTISGITITAGTTGNATGTGTAVYAGEAGLKIIRGIIQGSDAATLAGSGFSTNHDATGTYTVTFTTAFSARQTQTVSIDNDASSPNIIVIYQNTSSFKVYIRNSAGSLTDFNFGFIAIGPK